MGGSRVRIALATASVFAALFAPRASTAAAVASVSPQGEVAQVRQVVVRFDAAVVPFGDLRQPDPAKVDCQGAVVPGSGRWSNDRTWLYDLREALPPGVRCSVALREGWAPSQGTLTGRTAFVFQTGGPAVARVLPYNGSRIDEDQHFLLELTGPAAEATVAGHVWCEVEGIGERIPAGVVTGSARDAVIKARRLEARAPRLLLVACQRPLPNDVRLRLVWGAGIGAQSRPALVTRVEQRFDFTVRGAFTAEFGCERERANAPCLPVRPMTLRFSEPVSRLLAQQVRLRPAAGAAIEPVFDKDDSGAEVTSVAFPKSLPENARFTVEVPDGLKDAAGRPLANARSFPLAVATGDAPPIAKFAAAPFGIVESTPEPVLPVTLRHVQGGLRPGAPGGQVRVRRFESPADILAWYGRMRRHHETRISAREAGRPAAEWQETVTDTDARGRTVQRRVDREIATREISLLKDDPAARRLDLPQLQGGDPRPFEVVGIPLPQPGYHVVEIESQRLGAALLAKPAPMFVRTGVLVTNLGVHFKHGRQNSLVWVTTLDRARPVEGADVTVHDCRGKALWSGRTGADGLARIERTLEPETRGCVAEEGFFVTARKDGAPDTGAASGAGSDIAFVFSSWQQGIEPWRFNVPIATGAQPDQRAHTVFDRTLLRAGETVSMKHFLRSETLQGLALPDTGVLPTRLRIVHEGSGQEFTQPLQWAGARSAASTWAIPVAAKLGLYRVVLEHESADARQRREWDSGDFRVEEFRLPLVDARLVAPKDAVVAPAELPLDVQINYFSGGPMAGAALRATALLRDRAVQFDGYGDFSFEAPRDAGPQASASDDDEGAAQREGRLVADKLALATDAQGAARLLLKALPPITRPSEIVAEVAFNDPNGEVQTIASTVPLWPAAVVLGVKTGAWASSRGQVSFSVVALDTAGRPLKGQAVDVRGRLAQVISTRKRIVGGFYAYDNRTETQDLGALCSGRTDDRGLLLCSATLEHAGQVELVAHTTDAAGHVAQAASSLWITKQGELWFAQDNDDRIDVLPEKKAYEPGETARLQVRMPFREATALVSVEREGIVETRLVTLRGDDPTVDLKVDAAWGPNVYVSVLAVRGRIRDVPWYSFFSWGWKAPLEWARSFWYEGREYAAPTAMVDLSKPAFKLGVAGLKVGIARHALQVQVTADRPQYTVRGKAVAHIKVTQDGQPAAGADVAFAAVDEGLLALRPNASWDLLHAMLRERGWGVQTSTAQSEIIGRRHYGRKAVAAGGGGGQGGTRELFDTLLLWRPTLALDANGEATVEVPLNDSLTGFRLVAVADGASAAGVQAFGTGSTSIRVTQDLQVLSGLPPLVRDGDRFAALLTLRNTTAREMKVHATLSGRPAGPASGATAHAPIELPAQDLLLAAGGAKEVTWNVDVPADVNRIEWDAAVEEQGGAAPVRDRLKVTQQVQDAVPLRVLQATLAQLDGPYSLPVAAPADALPANALAPDGPRRGGLVVAVQPGLTGALPGLRRFFETYPFSCLEQKTSKAIGLHDAALWSGVANALPTYLDSDGLAAYFPPRAGDPPRGSDRLTAYVLAAAHEARFELPPAARERMLEGLAAFVQGRIERRFWAPRNDVDVRKIAAIEALARYGRAQPRLLDSVHLTPGLWPTAAVIDWLSILKRVDGIPAQARHLGEAQQILRARLTFAGTTLKFSTEDTDFWWWLMDSGDANAARLILAVLDDPAWKDDLPRLIVGHLGRQRGGAWLTTTANLWGSLALDKFSARFEATPVAGRTVAHAAAVTQAVDWAGQPDGGRVTLPWPARAGTLGVEHEGAGKPWLTVQALAAVPLKGPLVAGYAVERSLTAVERKDPARWSRGDVLRVRLAIDAQSDMTWVVVSDPVPGGATILGSGLGRDSAIATRDEKREGRAWPAFDERGFAAFRSYFDYLPRGRHVVEYTLRLNNPGRFLLPPTRVEAMYAPETFGEVPNVPLEVAP